MKIFVPFFIVLVMALPVSGAHVLCSVHYDLHAPIRIEGNDQFTLGNGVRSGDGSSGDPYVISGWDVPISFCDLKQGVHGVSICNTTAFFTICDCRVSSLGGRIALMVLLLAGHQSAGVYLENVTNGAVENCTIQGLFDCIQLKKASYNVITNCTSFRNCCGIGINFGSDNNTVEYCHTNNFGCSICLWEDVHNNTVSNSTCCGAPIRILNSSYNLIRNCTFTPSVKRNLYTYKKSTIGLELNNSQNNTIKDCTFFLKRIGVLSINSPNNAIAGCHFYLCLKTIIMTVRDR